MKIYKRKMFRSVLMVVCALAMLVMIMPTALAAGYDVLRYGDTGTQVTNLQQSLYNKGYLSVPPTGYYGWMTETAVTQFQNDKGLTADGIAGQNTQSALFATTSSSVLKMGSTGSNVTALQEKLHDLGYLDYKGATGYYGQLTKIAVIRFQNNHWLTADGVADSATTAKLYSSATKSLILKTSSSGEATSALQQKLKQLGYYTYGEVTGYYGNVTKSAVISFQRTHGLTADGIAGPNTRNKLFSGNVSGAPSVSTSKIADTALAQVGKTYVLGAEGPSTYDCSGLVHYAVNNAGLSVNRLSAAAYSEYSAWTKVTGTASLKKGDVVFFHSDTSSYISHVGIYIGDGEFVHASSGQARVMVSSLNNVYWARNYAFARQVN